MARDREQDYRQVAEMVVPPDEVDLVLKQLAGAPITEDERASLQRIGDRLQAEIEQDRAK